MSNSTQTRDINNTVSFYLNVTLVSVHPLVPNSDLFLIFRRIIHTPHHLRRALRAFINITSPTCRHPFFRSVVAVEVLVVLCLTLEGTHSASRIELAHAVDSIAFDNAPSLSWYRTFKGVRLF